MRLQFLIDELNKRSPSFEEYNQDLVSYGAQPISFQSYEDMNLLNLGQKKWKKYVYDFKNEILNELYSYSFTSSFGDVFSLLYPHIRKGDFIIFGSGENGMLYSYIDHSEEVILLDEDTYDIYQYACKDIDTFFQFLIQLKEVETAYNYHKKTISKATIEKLVYLVGGDRFREFIEDSTLRYTEFW